MLKGQAARMSRWGLGILQRVILGTGMSLIVFVVERQLSRRARPVQE